MAVCQSCVYYKPEVCVNARGLMGNRPWGYCYAPCPAWAEGSRNIGVKDPIANRCDMFKTQEDVDESTTQEV